MVMRDDGSLGASCAASCRKLGDYWKETSWESLGSFSQNKKAESSFKESIKGVREAEHERRKAKGFLQGQKEVIIYVRCRPQEDRQPCSKTELLSLLLSQNSLFLFLLFHCFPS